MNKSKFAVPAQLRKKMNKAIRSSTPTPEPKLTTDDIKAKDLLSRLPSKVRKKETAFLAAVKKEIDTKKVKKGAKHAKRTTPGTVDSQSAPRHAHMENERWVSTMKRQTAAKNKTLSRKLSKRK